METVEAYNFIADVKELEWFFNNVVQKPTAYEAYQVYVCARAKRLTDEQKASLGPIRGKHMFLNPVQIRPHVNTTPNWSINNVDWTFDNFYEHLRRLNFDPKGQVTSTGQVLPRSCMEVLFQVNPYDELKVLNLLNQEVIAQQTSITRALMHGKDCNKLAGEIHSSCNIERSLNSFRANARSESESKWLDYDIDIPDWFRCEYHKKLVKIFDKRVKKGNYVLINTAGGHHVLVRTSAFKFYPGVICEDIRKLYEEAVEVDGKPPYVDAEGNNKFECTINNASIPAVPLPGTYQYGLAVTVLNKEDFEKNWRNRT